MTATRALKIARSRTRAHPRAKRQRYAQSELRHFPGYESFLRGVLVVPNDNKAHPILISKRRRRKKIFVAPPIAPAHSATEAGKLVGLARCRQYAFSV